MLSSVNPGWEPQNHYLVSGGVQSMSWRGYMSNKVWVYTDCNMQHQQWRAGMSLISPSGKAQGTAVVRSWAPGITYWWNLQALSSLPVVQINIEDGLEKKPKRKQQQYNKKTHWRNDKTGMKMRTERSSFHTEMVRERERWWKKDRRWGDTYQQVLYQLLDVGRSLRRLFTTGCQLDQCGQKVSTLFHILQCLLQAHTHKCHFFLNIHIRLKKWEAEHKNKP